MLDVQGRRLFWIISFASLIVTEVYADTSNNFCGSPPKLLSLINRPTFPDSPCTVPYKKTIVEMGYQYLKLVNTGYAQNVPQAELRFGLPQENELYIQLPGFNYQTFFPHSGFNGVDIGLKHKLAYTSNWIVTIEGDVLPPSGSSTFGNQGWGGDLNLIYSFNLSTRLTFTGMLGFTTQTLSSFAGGARFSSFNPDGFLTWNLTDRLQMYGEIYGQSKTAPGQGIGFIAASGFIYLVNKHFTVDIEASQRLRGAVGGYENFVETGLTFEF